MDLNDVYSQIIMEHASSSEHKHELINETCFAHGYNPNCGDDITLHLKLEGEIIKDISFTGNGCAISQSSTSIMIDTLQGKTVEEAKKIIDIFIKMIDREEISKDEEKLLREAVALQNISNMPARVKCALLAWKTLKDKINEQ